MKKINKEFEERCIKLKNRIQRLKTEEEGYRNKLRNYRRREEQDKQIKSDKERLKLELKKNREEQSRALIDKKSNIRLKKENDMKFRQDKRNENLSQKKNNYKNFLTDKYLMKIIKEQITTQQKNKNAYSHAKIKQEYNEYETNKMKKNKERENLLKIEHENNIKELKDLQKEMRKTCNKLEVIEKEYIEKLNKTKYTTMKIMGDNKSFNYSYNINSVKNKNKLKINKSMEDMNINGIVNDNEEDDDYKYRNKSLIVNKNKNLSPYSKSQKNMIKSQKQKQKGKYGSISINFFPKTNRGVNPNKTGINNNSSLTNKDKENKQLKKKLFKNNNRSINK